MSRHDSLINRAIGVALTSNHRWRHGAVIAKGNRVVAFATNTKRNSPEIDHANSTWHAEVAALRDLHRSTGNTYRYANFKGCTMYVARVNTKNQPSFSRPCKGCWEWMVSVGITDVYYTNELGTLSHESIL